MNIIYEHRVCVCGGGGGVHVLEVLWCGVLWCSDGVWMAI